MFTNVKVVYFPSALHLFADHCFPIATVQKRLDQVIEVPRQLAGSGQGLRISIVRDNGLRIAANV